MQVGGHSSSGTKSEIGPIQISKTISDKRYRQQAIPAGFCNHELHLYQLVGLSSPPDFSLV